MKSLALAFLLLVSSNAYASTASWYSYESCIKEGTNGRITASGEKFDHNSLTCAMPSYKFGGIYKVTNLKNGKSVIVRHTDYGPNKKLVSKGRIIDLSKASFAKIAPLSDGVIPVSVEVVK